MDRAKDEICGLRYGPERKGYFWIHNMDLKMVKHPFKPQLNGKSLAAVADPNGKFLFKEMNEVCQKDGEGFVEYMWAKPGSKEPVQKLSFVQLHPETGWIVGTGIYIDDITEVVMRQEKQVSQAINAQIRSIVLIALMFILVMIAVFSYISMKISRPISEASEILGEIASGEGDLTTRMEVSSNDEIGVLANNFNLFVKKLQAIIGKVAENTSEVHVSSSDLSGLSNELHRLSEDSSSKTEHVVHSSNEASMNMNSVASAMEEYATNMTAIATATEEMSSTIHEIVESTETASSMTQEAMQQTSNMVTQLDSLHIATAKISEFVGTITDISDQVNLLALNATIEAARAGDAGKGFAVVASEIKELARQTSDASTQIQENIGLIVSSSEGTTTEIKKITQVVDQINEIIIHIGTALEQQSIATSEITTNISQASEGIGDVNANVSQTAELVHEVQTEVEGVEQNSKQIISQSNKVRDTSGSLRILSDQLEELVSRFKY
jgi:methyl-accepting chemotaxis protein